MAGFIKKGMLIITLFFVLFSIQGVSALTLEDGARAEGYHYTLYTYGIQSMYSDVLYVPIRESMLVVGWDDTKHLVLKRANSNGDYSIYPDALGRALILTTESYGTVGSGTSGSIYVFAGTPGDVSGNVLLGVTTTGQQRGYVGVGTNTPQQMLDVNGNIRISQSGGYLTSSGNFIIRLS